MPYFARYTSTDLTLFQIDKKEKKEIGYLFYIFDKEDPKRIRIEDFFSQIQKNCELRFTDNTNIPIFGPVEVNVMFFKKFKGAFVKKDEEQLIVKIDETFEKYSKEYF